MSIKTLTRKTWKKTLTRKTWKKPHSLTLPPPGDPQNNNHIPPSPAGHWLAVGRVRTTSHHASPFVHQFLSICLFVHLLVVPSFPRRVLMFSQSAISTQSFIRSFLPSLPVSWCSASLVFLLYFHSFVRSFLPSPCSDIQPVWFSTVSHSFVRSFLPSQ